MMSVFKLDYLLGFGFRVNRFDLRWKKRAGSVPRESAGS
jgi:hypothetical protein